MNVESTQHAGTCPHAGVATPTPGIPEYDVDYYGDDFILDPYPHYAAMRRLGSVVALPQVGTYAVTRYEEIRAVLRDWETYSSAEGVAGDEAACAFSRGNTLQSDPPRHDILRSALIGPLLPGALEQERPRIQAAADDLVDRLTNGGTFDGMDDFARFLPLTVVRDLVGLPIEGRDSMLAWASAAFDFLGSQNDRGRQAFEVILDMADWIATQTGSDRLREGSWTARIREMEASGEIDPEMAPHLILAYIGPSLDTTIAATGELLYQLGRNPAEWEKLRGDPSQIPGAVHEAIRMCTPIRSFTRKVTRDTELAGTPLAAGTRVTLMFASANRDERKFPDPDVFRVDRNPQDHVGFGHGIHMCAGMHLARLEMECLLRAMIPRVERIEVGQPQITINNTIRSYQAFPTRFHRATGHPGRLLDERATTRTAADASMIEVHVVHQERIAQDVVAIEFSPVDGLDLPAFEPGAHIDVEIRPGLVRQYSLCGDPAELSRYGIAVKLEPASRGGSSSLHRPLPAGTRLRISQPRNMFQLDESAENSALFAAGIGITPIISMVRRLNTLGAEFRLHYSVRTSGCAAFLDELTDASIADRVRLYTSNDPGSGRLNIATALEQTPRHTTLYICGPNAYSDAVLAEARRLGWSEDRLVVERFSAPTSIANAPFTLVAARSNTTLEVPAGTTALEALENAGIVIPSSCRTGVCATCLTRVIDGVPNHVDLVQTDAEKLANTHMAVCCSRSLTPRIVLDV